MESHLDGSVENTLSQGHPDWGCEYPSSKALHVASVLDSAVIRTNKSEGIVYFLHVCLINCAAQYLDGTINALRFMPVITTFLESDPD